MYNRKWLALLPALLSGMALAAPDINPDTYRALVTDRRAYSVGDVITVVVVESTTAQSQAGTDATADTKLAGTITHTNSQPNIGLELSGNTTGSGETSRSGQVSTKVGVRITGTLSGGQLSLAGDQTVVVNDEKQHIIISGLIRPDDIAADNTVLSYRLANANIQIVGEGVVNEAQKQNFFFRALKWLRLI